MQPKEEYFRISDDLKVLIRTKRPKKLKEKKNTPPVLYSENGLNFTIHVLLWLL